MIPFPTTIAEAMAIAAEFDKQRSCWWNDGNVPRDYLQLDYRATDFPETASLGDCCWGDLMELALLTTLRPCRCGNTRLYKSGYQIACCQCFGDGDVECDDCRKERKEGDGPADCGACAENMNLRDAITLWNLRYSADGPAGQVEVVG